MKAAAYAEIIISWCGVFVRTITGDYCFFLYFYAMSRYCFLVFFFLYAFLFYPQTRKMDSVRALLRGSGDDHSRLKQLEAMMHYQEALSNIDSAIYFGQQAIQIALRLNERTDLCDLYAGVGVAYKEKGEKPRALELLLKGQSLAEEMGDRSRVADNYLRMGTLYDEQKDYDKALKNYYTALSVYKKTGRKDRISMVTGNIGNIYFSHTQFEKALEFYLAALAIDKELNNKENMEYSLGYIGMVYSQLARKDKSKADSFNLIAKDYYRHALEIAIERHNIKLEINWLGNIGVADLDAGNFKQAEKSLLRTLAIADSLGFTEEKIQFEEAISEAYYSMKDYKRSIDHYRIFTREKDSMFTVEKEREIARHEMNYEFEKKMSDVKSEQERKEAVAEARARQQKLIIISVIAGLIILTVALIVILKALRTTRLQKTIIEKQKQDVDEKQKEIIDSIYYAKRIQQSLLATESYINRNLSRLKK
jgi:tetratricopeptide (TPR) repeat protein